MKSVDGIGFRFADENDRPGASVTVKLEGSGSGSRKRGHSAASGGSGKSVEQYDVATGEVLQVFASGSQAAKLLDLPQTSISQCCLGRRDSLGEFGFRFVQDGAESSGSSDGSDGARARRKARRSGGPASGGGGSGISRRCKSIEQYDRTTGELIATHASGKECAETTGINRNTISLCCYGRQKGVYNFTFRFVGHDYDEDDLSSDNSDDDEEGYQKAVEQYSLASNESIQEFTSSHHASDALGVPLSSVYLCCTERINGVGEVGFRFADPVDRVKVASDKIARKRKSIMGGNKHCISGQSHEPRKNKKPVEQYDLASGDVIQTYESGMKAATALGINRTTVSLCCIGKQKSFGPYSFRFADQSERQRAEMSDTFRLNNIQGGAEADRVDNNALRPIEAFDLPTGATVQVLSNQSVGMHTRLFSLSSLIISDCVLLEICFHRERRRCNQHKPEGHCSLLQWYVTQSRRF
jgi:hypothetical protein